MKQRGRKSSLAIATDPGITSQARAEPPVDLTPEQRVEWLLVVNACPAEWFPPETYSLLAQYSKHVVVAKHVAELIQDIEKGDEIDVGEYDKLLKMQERESRVIMSLATKMRLSQQSSYDKEKTKGKRKDARAIPWEK